MKQQINLYQGAMRREKPAFSASAMLSALLVCAGLSIGAWLLADRQADRLDGQAMAATAQEAAAAARLQLLTETLNRSVDGDAEADTLEAVLQGLARRERLLALVNGEGMGDTTGFSRTLAALAQQETPGLWLTRILVSAPGSRTTLEGRARAPFLVPAYLLGLSSEVALVGQRFDQFQIDRPDEPGTATVRFSMTSDSAETFALGGDLP